MLGELCVIADALERWYVREQQSRGLLAVNRNLCELALRRRWVDVAALASIRMATAHRLALRLGEAAAALEVARAHAESVTAERARAELSAREKVEHALLAMTGAEPDQENVRTAAVELGRLRTAGNPAVLINLGALLLGRGRAEAALELLWEAEEAATAAQDDGARAHAVELQGVALARIHDRLVDAVRCWQRALDTFTRIGEERGEARCLQHLGSAALTHPAVASYLRNAGKTRLDARAAARVALPLLERAKALRVGQPDTALVDRYLRQARELSREP